MFSKLIINIRAFPLSVIPINRETFSGRRSSGYAIASVLRYLVVYVQYTFYLQKHTNQQITFQQQSLRTSSPAAPALRVPNASCSCD
jgi:hypothetical protein